jgi:hypothetical protein
MEIAMRRVLIGLGIALVIAGIAWPWLQKLPLGRLPGDIMIERPGFKMFFPFMTMLIVSIVLSILMWLFRK